MSKDMHPSTSTPKAAEAGQPSAVFVDQMKNLGLKLDGNINANLNSNTVAEYSVAMIKAAEEHYGLKVDGRLDSKLLDKINGDQHLAASLADIAGKLQSQNISATVDAETANFRVFQGHHGHKGNLDRGTSR